MVYIMLANSEITATHRVYRSHYPHKTPLSFIIPIISGFIIQK